MIILQLIISKFLAIGVLTFLFNFQPIFNNVSRSLPRELTEWTIFDICVFDNVTSAGEWFVKALQRFETFLPDNNSLRGK